MGYRPRLDGSATSEVRWKTLSSARGSTDRASDYGSEGWGFESLRARNTSPSQTSGWGLLLSIDRHGRLVRRGCVQLMSRWGFEPNPGPLRPPNPARRSDAAEVDLGLFANSLVGEFAQEVGEVSTP
jgi:hypothetical protein